MSRCSLRAPPMTERVPLTVAVASTPAGPSGRPRARAVDVLYAGVLPLVRLGEGSMGIDLYLQGFRRTKLTTREGDVVSLLEAPGSGPCPALVLIHGLGGNAVSYAALLKQLLPMAQRVIAIDLPNHGKSSQIPSHRLGQEACMRAVTEVLNTRLQPDGQAAIIGHSLGGWVAMRYALNEPQRVARLLLQAPDGAPWAASDIEPLRAQMLGAELGEMLSLGGKMWSQEPLRARLMAPFMGAIFAQPAMQGVVRSDLLQPTLALDELGHLAPQVSLIFGQDDQFRSPTRDAYLERALPASRQVYTLPIGHGAIVDGPPCIVSLIGHILASRADEPQPDLPR